MAKSALQRNHSNSEFVIIKADIGIKQRLCLRVPGGVRRKTRFDQKSTERLLRNDDEEFTIRQR
jgi:hypothetical protein